MNVVVNIVQKNNVPFTKKYEDQQKGPKRWMNSKKWSIHSYIKKKVVF